ncbi:MAG: type III pantothenate kinase, partial [Bacilli bacterium]|nr:type III pantothenate kinase [Bacilli bacterium]
MNLCIDVGNTTIGVGFFKEEQLLKRLSYTVDTTKTSDEYISVIKRTLKDNGFDANEIQRIIFSSVVPSVNDELILALKSLFGVEPLLIAPGVKTGLPIHVD